MINYDPDGKFNHLFHGETATDTFSYVVRDDDTGESTGTVTVTIHGATHVPVVVGGSALEHNQARTRDGIVIHDYWIGDYFAKPVATDQLFPDERSNQISLGAQSRGTWYIAPFFFGWRTAQVQYSIPITCNGNKVSADTNSGVKTDTNNYVTAMADSTANYNDDQTRVTVTVALAAAYGNAPSVSVNFGSSDGGDEVGASIDFQNADFKISTTGDFVYECRRWY
jgi:hypothetical protein